MSSRHAALGELDAHAGLPRRPPAGARERREYLRAYRAMRRALRKAKQ